MQIVRLGLDLAKYVSKFTASTLIERRGIVKLTNWGRATGKEGRCPTTAALSIAAIAFLRK